MLNLDLFVIKFKTFKSFIEIVELIASNEKEKQDLVRWAEENSNQSPSKYVLWCTEKTRFLQVLTMDWYKYHYSKKGRKIRAFDSKKDKIEICHLLGIFFSSYERKKESQGKAKLLGLSKTVELFHVNRYEVEGFVYYNVGLRSVGSEDVYKTIVDSSLLAYFKKSKNATVYAYN